MEEKVLKTIKKYELIKSGDNIVLGISGGPDSICMLYILNSLKKDLKFNIYVAHINHMLRENAKLDEEYVKNTCKKLNIPVYIKHIQIKEIAEKEKRGIEETGRKVRYKFFEEILRKTNSNKIATAHNLNDSIETIILNIIRGTGISGLAGIEPIRENKFIRPLIECERKEIEEYCKLNKLEPRIDESNYENKYNRNKIRNICIPYLQKELNSNVIKNISRLSEIANEEQKYIEKNVEKSFNKICIENTENKIILDIKMFVKEELVIKRRLILYTINKLIGTTINIEKINIDDIIKLCERNIGNKFLIPTKGIKVFVKKGKIEISKSDIILEKK